MENIIIHTEPSTPYIPEILFDADKGICDLSGESYMEETYKFYLPLIEWIHKYFIDHQTLVFNFKFIYFNTSTSRIIIDLLVMIKEYISKGNQITVNWYYNEDDPDMKDEIQDFIEETGINIIIIKIN